MLSWEHVFGIKAKALHCVEGRHVNQTLCEVHFHQLKHGSKDTHWHYTQNNLADTVSDITEQTLLCSLS